MNYTALNDQDHKLDVIDHVNQDHSKELIVIAQSYTQNPEISAAQIIDIYQEGILLQTQQHSLNNNPSQHFIAFALKGELEEQILYLAYHAFAKQKIQLTNQQQQFFEVLDQCQISQNIIRLTLKSLYPFPSDYAAHAYGFVLKKLEKKPDHHSKPRSKSTAVKHLFNRAVIFLMKHLSTRRRQKLIRSMNKDIRLYTLRQAFSVESDSIRLDHGYVDIFCHAQSAGSLWASSLQAGDLICSRSEAEDKHHHLLQGQTVLIADETAYAAVAGILELWSNPQPPIVILCAVDAVDLAYFDSVTLPEGSQLHQRIAPSDQHAAACLVLLTQIETIDGVWAALEYQAAKQIRHYLRNQRQLSGKNNHVKAYWRSAKQAD